MPNEIKFDDAGKLAAVLAQSVADDLARSLRMHGNASLIVSGGRTPAAFLAALSHKEIDWNRVGVTLVDERWVGLDHVDSNEALVRRTLLQNRAVDAHFAGMKNSAATPFEGEAECEKMLASLSRPFDIVLLGMGDDGHTASLFPQAPQLAAALDMHSGKRCIGINPVTAPHARMSLTLPALLSSRRIIVLINGSGKWDVYQNALQAGPVEAFPVRSILNQAQVPVDVYWSP